MANLNIRVDDALKKQAEAIFSDIGMSMSTATIIFLKQVVRCNGIPFELKADPAPNALTLAAMEEAELGRNLSKTFGSVEELMEDLNA